MSADGPRSQGATTAEPLSPVKQALAEIRLLRARLSEMEHLASDPIAIIGLGCRVPGAGSPEAFWTLLHDGRDAIREIPASRWDASAFYDHDPDVPGKMSTRWGGFLDDVDRFDAGFFGITPREAATMDPQQRLLLEVVWEALEDAGVAATRIRGSRAGVFIGASASDYMQLLLRDLPPARMEAHLGTGGSPSVLSGRVSYLLGIEGPSVTIDTACSGSLAAVHLACQSLRARECSVAIAGGVSLMLIPELTVVFSKARMLAADGRCKTFDAAADGYVRSEGCGVVVLKPLRDAVADGDRIWAVVRGSAINQDGRSSGLTAPNGPAQEAVIRAALERAGVTPKDVAYVEAHGTGTALGDPIEMGALGRVFAGRPAAEPLIVGSVKTNVGHLEAASGVVGLIKTTLALAQEEIPPHLHFRTPSPFIDWAALPVAVAATARPWPRADRPRIAGVSAFGFSGTNVHVVLEESPVAATAAVQAPRTSHLLPVSAQSPQALTTATTRMLQHLEAHPELALGDVCHTAGAGRSHGSHRLAIAGGDRDDVTRALRAAIDGVETGSIVGRGIVGAGNAPEIAFLFTGQGLQYAGMGKGLYDTEPVFRDALDRCAALLASQLDRPLLPLLFDASLQTGDGRPLLDETVYTQPALFAFEYALCELWRSLGVQPTVVAGHSVGEDVAACIAGVYNLADGLALIAERGRLMQALPRDGAMVVAFCDEERVAEAVAPYREVVSIAAINGPAAITVSGERTALGKVAAVLERDGVKIRDVRASHAFHSPLMEPMLGALEDAVRRTGCRAPSLPMVSTLTGQNAGDEMSTALYWRRHVREPVRFAAAMQTLWARGCRLFVEIGPAPTLLSLGRRAVPEGGVWAPSVRPDRDDSRELLSSIGALFAAGVAVDWPALTRGRGHQTVSLPTYPFERRRHWYADSTSGAHRPAPVDEVARSERAWAAACSAGRRQAGEAPFDLAVSSYADRWTALDSLARLYMARALAALGAFQQAGERLTIDELVGRFGIAPIYGRLVERWLVALAADGQLRQEGDAFVADRSLAPADPRPLLEAQRAQVGADDSYLDYVMRSGERLPDLLRERAAPLDLLFADTPSLAERLYASSPIARYSNAIVHEVIAAAASDASADRPLRVLEIGGGTGGTTVGLLERLAPERTRYLFTDIGSLFIGKARERFAGRPDVTCAKLDIERHPRDQHLPEAAADVVVAVNVLHATTDLNAALAHAAWLVAPGGMLVLCEATEHAQWIDMTMGLIGGWQRFADDLRTDGPLLAPGAWCQALRQHGFDEVVSLPEAGSPASVLRQHVIVARRSGAGAAAEVTREQTEWPVAGDAGAVVTPLADGERDGASFRARLAELPPLEQHEQLARFVGQLIVRVVGLDASQTPARDARLMDIGIDSLMAVEFRSTLAAGLGHGASLPATLIFDHPTIDAIATYVQTEVFAEVIAAPPREAVHRTGEIAPTALSADAVADMSDEDVEALLNQRLEGR